MTQLSHDALARTELHRENVFVTQADSFGNYAQDCAWCGSVRRTRTGKPFLYRYSTTRDDAGRASVHKGLFCSKSCHDSYHG